MVEPIEPHVMPTYARADEVFVSGAGAVLRDADGNEFLDFLSGIAVTALGHAHPRLTAALQEQVARLTHVSNLFRHPHTEHVAARLCAHAGMHKAFFTNSGAESIECALKLARKAMHLRGEPERTSFVALEGAFHGRTLGALSLTYTAKYRAPFAPLLDVAWVPPDDGDALAAALRQRRPAALVVEPIQGEGGIRELQGSFLRAARALCDETGTVLIHDEIQSGCGRTGEFLAAQHHGVTPDVVALAKPIAAGLPMGACLASAAFADVLQPGEHGTTFGGGPLVCRAASVFLDELDRGLLDAVAARGAQLRQGLERIAAEAPAVREVRGRGLMLGVRLDRPAKDAQQALHRAGLIVNVTQTDVLRIVPPFVVTEDQIDRALQLLREVLTSLPARTETTP
ncbi:MAG: acetylornithine transaminase [Planctomycetes bacterium]|nr:acetylornithine transaminase [Planctomycetota bacterium]